MSTEAPSAFFQEELFEELYHDLKTPISILFAYIQLLERINGLPPQAQRYLQEARKNCFRVAKLVRDANDGARINKGKLLPQFVNDDLVALVAALCESAKVLTDPKRLEIRFESRIPQKVMALDRQIMERILLNLLSNAKQHSHEDGVINVSVWEDNGDVHISVRDYGPGVSGDMAQSMFRRGVGSERGLHSGLGLYIVSELASLLGGEVYLMDSKPGAEVAVRLPVFLTDAAAEDTPLDDFFNDNMVQMELSF